MDKKLQSCSPIFQTVNYFEKGQSECQKRSHEFFWVIQACDVTSLPSFCSCPPSFSVEVEGVLYQRTTCFETTSYHFLH